MNLALAIVALLLIASAGFVVAGVWLLAGMAWAFLAIGAALFGAGVLLRSGLNLNG